MMHSGMFVVVCIMLMFTCNYFFIFVFFMVLSVEPVCYEEIWARFVDYSDSALVYSDEDLLQSL